MNPLPHPAVFVQDTIPPGILEPVRELGRKGMSLRRIFESGQRVPRGFTLRAEVCRRFLASEGRWPENVWDAVVAGVRRLEMETGCSFASTGGDPDSFRPPLRLAVRSGAAESMPGLLKTHLGLGGSDGLPTESTPPGDPWDSLRDAIADVFRSWEAASARYYRQSHGIEDSLGTAVNVQEMIACEFSGVLFTRSPDPPDADVMSIEAVAGTGEELVGGRANPHQWTVRRDNSLFFPSLEVGEHVSSRLAEQLPLLCRCGLQLEEEFAFPLDIEWGIDSDGLVLFQARPITPLVARIETNGIRQRECDRLRSLAAQGAQLWVRHNLDQTLPQPTMLTWSLWRQFMSSSGGLGTLYRRLGYRPSRRSIDEGFLLLIGGRIFADPDRATAMFGDDYPFRYDQDLLRRDPAALERAPTLFDPDLADPWLLWRLPTVLWRTLRSRRRLGALFRKTAEVFENHVRPRFLETVSKERRRNLTNCDVGELISLFETRRRLVMDQFAPESLLPGLLGGMAYAELEQHAARILGPEAGPSLAGELVPSGDRLLLQRQQCLLLKMSEQWRSDSAECGMRNAEWGAGTLDDHSALPTPHSAFFDEFGHRAIGEMELAVPRWRETPELVAQLARESNDAAMANRRTTMGAESYAAAERSLDEVFTRAGASSLVDDAKFWLDRCWRLLPYRDRGKHIFLMGYELLRRVTEPLAERLGLGSQFYDLSLDEWPDLVGGKELTHVITERRQERDVFRQMILPDVIEADQIEAILESNFVPDATVEILEATPLVSGHGTGVVCLAGTILLDNADDSGRVLVCEALEPAFSPMLARLSAAVVEQGGALSHGAILARQWGLPVVRLPAATRRFSPGDRLHVDGDTGCVRILGGESS